MEHLQNASTFSSRKTTWSNFIGCMNNKIELIAEL
jgi:hypothetical protein